MTSPPANLIELESMRNTRPPDGNPQETQQPTGNGQEDQVRVTDLQAKSVDEHEKAKTTLAAVIMACVASLGGFIFGWASGQVSGFFSMKNFQDRFAESSSINGQIGNGFSAVRQGLMVGFMPLGAMLGALIGGRIADRFGRRTAICASAFWACFGITIEISSGYEWIQFMLGRGVTGSSVGAFSVAVPMFVSESSPVHLRTCLVAFFQVAITLGILSSYLVVYGTHRIEGSASWRIPEAIMYIFAVGLGLGIWCLPESPRYDYRKGHKDKARRTIARLAGLDEHHPTVNDEIDQIRLKLEEETPEANSSWMDMFKAPRMLYRILLGIALQAGQQLTGANFFFYYGATIFQAVGDLDAYITQIVLGGVNVAATFLGLFIMNRLGRRVMLMAGAAVLTVCFVVYTFVGQFAMNPLEPGNSPIIGRILIVFSCLAIVSFAITWGPLAWTAVAEMYPAKHRAKCMGLATASNWLMNFAISLSTRFAIDGIHCWYGMVFAGCCSALFFIVLFFLMETKDRSLEEIETLYLSKVPARRSARKDALAIANQNADPEQLLGLQQVAKPQPVVVERGPVNGQETIG